MESKNIFYSPIGSEFVGTVLEVGLAVTDFKKGDRVMANTSYPFRTNGSMGGVPTNFASQGILLLEEDQLIKVPDSMPDEVAAAFQYLHKRRIAWSEKPV